MPPFFEALDRFSDQPACKYYDEAGQVVVISYQALEQLCQDYAQLLLPNSSLKASTKAPSVGSSKLSPKTSSEPSPEISREISIASRELAPKQEAHTPTQRQLIFLQTGNCLSGLVTYLACLRLNHVVMLVDEKTSQPQLEELIAAYHPNVVVSHGNITHLHAEQLELDARLALLLSTSGSTGSPKQVALSQANLQSNAASICAYLPILASDITLTTLPFNYSYGLSVINSHLQAGASVFLHQASIVDREFWDTLETQQISSIAGVPYSWEMLLRLGITKKELPFLRYFTQAGGKLASKRLQMLSHYAQSHGKSFYTMYGQTEATARMAFLAPERLAQKPESIGQAIPGGHLQLQDEHSHTITDSNTEGELVYSGDNVMLGYAEQRQDLIYFEPVTRLRTGDLAYFDKEGDFFITGRIKRFIKIHGLRISLDDIEKRLAENHLEGWAVGTDNALRVAVTKTSLATTEKTEADCVSLLATLIGVHHSTIRCLAVDNLLTTPNGKPDYVAIAAKFNS